MKTISALTALLLIAGCAHNVSNESSSDAGVDATTDDASSDTGTNVEDAGLDSGVIDDANSFGTGMYYHGGLTLTSPINVHMIYYGSWPTTSTADLIEYFINNLGATAYYQIDQEYYDITDAGQNYPTSSLTVADRWYCGYPYGTFLIDGNIEVLARDMASGTPNPNDIYIVLASSDVSEENAAGQYSGTDFCGWHSPTGDGSKVVFGSVDLTKDCNVFYPDSGAYPPNGDYVADMMVNIMAHELSESITDPNLNAWSSVNGEIGDLCAWQFGYVYYTADGGLANTVVGGKQFLIQQLYDLQYQACAMHPEYPR